MLLIPRISPAQATGYSYVNLEKNLPPYAAENLVLNDDADLALAYENAVGTVLTLTPAAGPGRRSLPSVRR
jgi:hypothetical protein